MTDQTIDAPPPPTPPSPSAVETPAPGTAAPEARPAETVAAETGAAATGAAAEDRAAEARGPRGLGLWLILLGAAMVLVGAAALAAPFVASLAVLAWIGALFIVAGLIQLLQTFGATGWKGALWHVASGGLYLLGGLLMAFEPLAGLVALSWLVVVTIGLSGLARVFAGLSVRPTKGWLWVTLGGFASVAVAGVLGAMMPQASLTVLGVLAGVSFLIEGAAALSLGLAARRAA